jgi:hypothetical protein
MFKIVHLRKFLDPCHGLYNSIWSSQPLEFLYYRSKSGNLSNTLMLSWLYLVQLHTNVWQILVYLGNFTIYHYDNLVLSFTQTTHVTVTTTSIVNITKMGAHLLQCLFQSVKLCIHPCKLHLKVLTRFILYLRVTLSLHSLTYCKGAILVKSIINSTLAFHHILIYHFDLFM